MVCNNKVECFKHLGVFLSSDLLDSRCDCIVCRIRGNTVSHTYICCIWGHICPVTALSTVLIGVTTPCIFYVTISWPVCLFSVLEWSKEWCLATLAWAFLCLLSVPHLIMMVICEHMLYPRFGSDWLLYTTSWLSEVVPKFWEKFILNHEVSKCSKLLK